MPNPKQQILPEMADTGRVIRLSSGPIALALLIACLPETTTTETRPPDPGYDAQAYIAQSYSGRLECAPTLSRTVEIVTVLEERASCPADWYSDTPTPCLQIEHENGLRTVLPQGLVGMQAIGTGTRRVQVAALGYPEMPSCIPTDTRLPNLIYVGPA